MLVDLIQDNPGEPPFKTRFRDPLLLHAYGYDALAISDALLALPGYAPVPGPGEGPSGVDYVADIDRRIAAAHEAGLKVFLCADALILPRARVLEAPDQFLCQDSGTNQRLCPGRPATIEAYAQAIRMLLERWSGPVVAGIIVRPGVVQHALHPQLIATALQETSCPHCRGLTLAARHQLLARSLYGIVGEEFGKIYVHRLVQRASPGAPVPHDDPQVFQSLVADLPISERLIFALAFYRGDGRYGQPLNPCLLDAARREPARPLWIEFPCQREFEGKGAFANFQAPRWSEFFQALESTPAAPDPVLPARYGLLSISRGTPAGPAGATSLGGPYAQREEWIDANVFALAELSRQPLLKPEAIARLWAARCFNVEPASAAATGIAEILALSAPTLQDLLYDPPRPGVGGGGGAVGDLAPTLETPWVQQDQLDVEAIWNAAARLQDLAAISAACARKRGALANVEIMRQRFEKLAGDLPNKSLARDLSNTFVFYNSFAGAVADLFCGFVDYFQWRRTGRTDAVLARRAAGYLEHAQAQWQHHTQRHAMLPGAPSVFQENTFWERTNDCLEEIQNVNA
jgi:hypothetical protein